MEFLFKDYENSSAVILRKDCAFGSGVKFSRLVLKQQKNSRGLF